MLTISRDGYRFFERMKLLKMIKMFCGKGCRSKKNNEWWINEIDQKWQNDRFSKTNEKETKKEQFKIIQTNLKKTIVVYCMNKFSEIFKKTIVLTQQTIFRETIFKNNSSFLSDFFLKTDRFCFLNQQFYWTNYFPEQTILLRKEW